MPPPVEGSHSTTPAATSRPQQSTSRPSSRPPASSQSRPTTTVQTPVGSQTSSSTSSSSTPAPITTTQAPAQPVAPSSTSPRAHSTPSSSTTSTATAAPVIAASTSKPVSTTTIAAASAAAAVVVVAIIAWQLYRLRRRRRSAVPPPRPFSTWVADRDIRGHTMYDTSDRDPYAMSSLASQSQFSSAKPSPTWEAPAFLTLPAHGRDLTSSDTSSYQASGTPSTAVSALPLISPTSGDMDGVLDPRAPFSAALSHQSSRGSFSSNRSSPVSFSNDGSPVSSPPPMDYPSGVAPITGSRTPSIHSTARSARRASAARPISYAPSLSARQSIYSVSASTIRGAPHQPHNRVEIVLPAPLAPQSFVPVAPFMLSHSRTGSDRSRMSMGAMSTSTYGQAWREESPSREGSIAATREDDVLSLRSQRSVTTVSASHSLPPVPPLPASVVRSASPSRTARGSDSPVPTRPSTSTSVSSVPSALGLSMSNASPRAAGPLSAVPGSPSVVSVASPATTEYSTPLASPQLAELLTPRAVALRTLEPKISLEQLAAAAVERISTDMGARPPRT
ncbi:hypothetical protein EXIGLDRAFT_736799 [Exidia glandulosa HHB12029]|uniref:Uncharacterized protein n=1 Tax=Exidia glandulosa HHB12029 TaxID=1314781 RepID=A0A165PF44_EXIGL|nr:hypothetical protein EXIGLDRAFT_736799 [Exidia glandulosa HHB12029]